MPSENGLVIASTVGEPVPTYSIRHWRPAVSIAGVRARRTLKYKVSPGTFGIAIDDTGPSRATPISSHGKIW